MRFRKLYTTLISMLLVICMAAPIAACGESDAVAESVEMDRSTLTLNVGEEVTLTYTVFPQSARTAEATWKSSDATVASVDNGKVKALNEGKTVIRVTVGGKFSDCNVTVNDPSGMPVPETGIALDKHSITMNVNETHSFQATLEPENTTFKNISWTSSKPAVAAVDQNGVVTALGGGRTIISAKSENGYEDSCIVDVAGESVIADEGLYVAQVPGLENRDDFIMGIDASEVLSIEAARKAENEPLYKNFDGQEEDVFKVLKDSGVTDIRVRIWNDPKDENGNSYGGGNCDINNAVAIAERCQTVGLGMIVDFHYSDFWADPGKQTLPKAWKGKSTTEIASSIYDFTKDSLTKLKDTKVKITMVQIGNETTSMLAGSSDWDTICRYINKGAEAVREVTGEVAEGGAKVAVHFTNAGGNGYMGLAKTLDDNDVDYDVFGSSWYPYYTSHGTLTNLKKQFTNIHNTYGKEAMILETAYAWTEEDFDGCGNTALETTTRPVTVQGMANAVRDVIAGMADLGDWGLGLCYWGGIWISASTDPLGATNRALCKEYGCGWATSYAKDYDDDANDGGSMVDNNAFFMSDGTPIEALKVFKYVKEGHTVAITTDYLQDQEVYCTVNEGAIELPKTVDVILNNGSELKTDVVWAIEPENLDQYITQVNRYEIHGSTKYGGDCICNVWVMNVNLLSEGSFESFKSYGDGTVKYVQPKSQLGDWDVTHTGGTSLLQLYVSNNTGNARMGTQSFHFWDEGNVSFTLSQTLTAEQLAQFGSGKYGCSFDFQGNDGVEIDIHAYVKIKYKDGSEEIKSAEAVRELLGWKKWQTTRLSGVELDLDRISSVEVGISVYAEFTGAGPWGNIDNCQFYFEE